METGSKKSKLKEIWQQLKSKIIRKAKVFGGADHFASNQGIGDAHNQDTEKEEGHSTYRSTFPSLKQQSQKNKIRQYVAAGIIGLLVCGISIYLLTGDEVEVPKKTESGFLPHFTGTKVRNLETAKDNINPDQIYKHRVQQEIEKTKNDVADIKKVLETKASIGSDSSDVSDKEVIELAKRVLSVEQKIDNMGLQSVKDGGPALSISKINVRLNNKEQKKLKTVDNTIPAGSFASGVLLSGLDASTSLSSSGNPTPMLIRLTDHGTLPRRFKSDLKDCHVIASGYGDISSERVLTRLERLTCIENLTGEILETGIAGYISGEDGKAGLRGVVVSKDFKYLANSAVGGILGGFSNTITPKQNIPFIATKDALSPPSIGERFQRGFGDGMSSSMDKLSQYYIDRAETLQPVIEVSAGRIVDIIFTQGVEIGSSVVKEELSLVRDESRKKAAKDEASIEE